jgi:hypothetical protein
MSFFLCRFSLLPPYVQDTFENRYQFNPDLDKAYLIGGISTLLAGVPRLLANHPKLADGYTHAILFYNGMNSH